MTGTIPIRKTSIFFQVLVLLYAFSLLSCATSKLTATWYDTGYGAGTILRDVLVIAEMRDEAIRRNYEDSFVLRLGALGVRAMPSYGLEQPDIEAEMPALTEAAREAGARFVLITRYLGTDTREEYRPPQLVSVLANPYYSRVHGYYPMAYREVYSPGYTVTVKTVVLESNLYDAGSGRLVWAARSESMNPSMTRQYVDELVEIYSDDLREKGLL